MTVRSAQAADVADVLALIRATPGLPQWGAEALAPLQPEPRAEGLVRSLLIAEGAGSLLGFAQVSVLLGEAELESMAVWPAWRDQGVGRALLQRAMNVARAGGATILRLEVRQSNEAALRLYRSAGMSVMGTRRGYYSGPVEDAFVLERSLRNVP